MHDLAEPQVDSPTAAPSRVAADEKQTEVDDGENGCLRRSIWCQSYRLK
jgi:hypothetical protein